MDIQFDFKVSTTIWFTLAASSHHSKHYSRLLSKQSLYIIYSYLGVFTKANNINSTIQLLNIVNILYCHTSCVCMCGWLHHSSLLHPLFMGTWNMFWTPACHVPASHLSTQALPSPPPLPPPPPHSPSGLCPVGRAPQLEATSSTTCWRSPAWSTRTTGRGTSTFSISWSREERKTCWGT